MISIAFACGRGAIVRRQLGGWALDQRNQAVGGEAGQSFDRELRINLTAGRKNTGIRHKQVANDPPVFQLDSERGRIDYVAERVTALGMSGAEVQECRTAPADFIQCPPQLPGSPEFQQVFGRRPRV
ncbi:MAG: hypothetical protein KatS3mg110_0612 [Pirellulaceae bacterium]|nr:MAG: hypothetical protein KatS3mg110_0612 [Pirellulaceae bacterium]